jgi:hypothetical protein
VRKLSVSSRFAGYASFALLAYYLLFSLPFRFPPSTRLESDSYVFGFNNAVAIAGLIALLVIATWLRMQIGRSPADGTPIAFADRLRRDEGHIPNRIYWLMAFLYGLLTVAAFIMAGGARFYGIDWESSHFLWRLKLMELYALRPYVDFHFEYGPALIYLPSSFHRLLAPFAVSSEASYYAFHYLVNLLGLYCIFALLNRALMPSTCRTIAFAIVGLASFAPYMGLNGVAARFLMPYLLLILIDRAIGARSSAPNLFRVLKLFTLWLLSALICISISAEIGLAFAVAVIAYSASICRSDVVGAACAVAALVVAFVLCRVLLPVPYFASLLSFAKGANNLPLLPAPHLLLYAATLFLAVPTMVAAGTFNEDPGRPLLFALAGLTLSLIPGALGRCDPPHVLFYGLGASLILFGQLANASRKGFALYSIAYAAVCIVGLQWSNIRVFQVSYRSVVSKTAVRRAAAALGVDLKRGRSATEGSKTTGQGTAVNSVSYLAALDKYPAFGLPFANYGTDKETERYLWAHRKIAPEYYVGAIGVYTEGDVSRKLQDVARNEYLLLSKGWWQLNKDRDICALHLNYIRLSFIYPAKLACKREPVDRHLEIVRFIGDSYEIVETAGDLFILKRKDLIRRPISDGVS